jgi:hypothetical protein
LIGHLSQMASFYTKWLQDIDDAQLADGGISSTVPYAKHFPPVDPSWPTFYAQALRLMCVNVHRSNPPTQPSPAQVLVVERPSTALKMSYFFVLTSIVFVQIQ